MTHGYHSRNARARRTRRRIRRGKLKPVQAYVSRRNPLKVRTHWTRYHPEVSSFSFGKRIKRGRRRL